MPTTAISETQNWSAAVGRTARNSTIEVIGLDDIKDSAQASVGIALLECFGNHPAGFLYFEPCTASSSARPADAVLCHPEIGVLVIEVKGYTVKQIERIQAGSLFVKLSGYQRPVNPFRQVTETMFQIKNATERAIGPGRSLPVFEYMVALPNITSEEWSTAGFANSLDRDHLLLADDLRPDGLKKCLARLSASACQRAHLSTPIEKDQINAVRLAFGDSAVINDKRPVRLEVDENRLGAYIDELANLDKHLSSEQQELSRLKVEGHPRLIRGVAGSGKTVVLANMAARYIARATTSEPNLFGTENRSPRVAVVCFNRALVPFLQAKIRDAYKQQTLESVPSGALLVTHLNGLMFHLIRKEGMTIPLVRVTGPDRVEDASQRAQMYRTSIADFAKQNPDWFELLQYDAIFVDEGQDFVGTEYQLLLDLIRTDGRTGEKPLVVFYDDAQNLYGKARPVWKDLGIDVQRGDRSRVMKECFRNTRQIVELGFNVLLGTCAPETIRVQTRGFADVSYLKQAGLVEERENLFRVKFAERQFQPPMVRAFSARSDEKRWIIEELRRLIVDESVRPEDILVLFHRSEQFADLPDAIKGSVPAGLLKGILLPFGKNDDKDSYIFREGHITISTTYGAKGYDASIVFVIGADLFDNTNEGRASFYVGATRAKLLLRVSGLNSAGSLLSEATTANERLTKEA